MIFNEEMSGVSAMINGMAQVMTEASQECLLTVYP
jgi:hypothetical protein